MASTPSSPSRDTAPKAEEQTEYSADSQTLPGKSKTKTNRNPRAYFTPEQMERYEAVFHSRAGKDGRLDATELHDYFGENGISIPLERLKAIISEVDDDSNGFLRETEFLVLLIKAMGVKKRKVGPGMCPLAQLVKEGWLLSDMKKLGYKYEDFVECGYNLAELMEVLTPVEMWRAGVKLPTILERGWDCVKAREQGFVLAEMVAAGCSMLKIRVAGWDDVASATQLRKLGVDAGRMKNGGWSLSELGGAGYSLPALRLAGYAPGALACLEQLRSRRCIVEPLADALTLSEKVD